MLCLADYYTSEVDAIRNDFAEGVVADEKAEKLLLAAEKGKGNSNAKGFSKELNKTASESETEDSEGEEASANEKAGADRDGPSVKPATIPAGRRQRLRDQSPFFRYFQRIFWAVRDDDHAEWRGTPGMKPNPYKNTKFLNYFMCQWLVIFPLWSIMTAGYVFKDGRVGLLTNGCVERLIRWIKETRLSQHHTLGPVGFIYRHQNLSALHCDTAQRYLELAKKSRTKSTKSKATRSTKVPKGYDKPLPRKPVEDFFCDPGTDSDEQNEEDQWTDVPGDVETETLWKSSKLSPSHSAALQAGSVLTPLQRNQGMETPAAVQTPAETIATALLTGTTSAPTGMSPAKPKAVAVREASRRKSKPSTRKRQRSNTFTATPKTCKVKKQKNVHGSSSKRTSRKLLPEDENPTSATLDSAVPEGGKKKNFEMKFLGFHYW
jgi:hypothetical protein